MQKHPLQTLPRLTPHMKELLIECHERELMNQQPCDVGSTNYAGGLLSRGLLELKPYITANGKKIMAMYITDIGRKILSNF